LVKIKKVLIDFLGIFFAHIAVPEVIKKSAKQDMAITFFKKPKVRISN
jgi:hypothetical protein